MTIASRTALLARHATIDAFDELVPGNRGLGSGRAGVATLTARDSQTWI